MSKQFDTIKKLVSSVEKNPNMLSCAIIPSDPDAETDEENINENVNDLLDEFDRMEDVSEICGTFEVFFDGNELDFY